jgi:dienelactone hydrolase
VLVVHEADGIGGNVRRHCALLAEMGYIAAAADMHGKGRPLTDAEIPEAMQAFAEDPATLTQRLGAAVDALASECEIARTDIAAIGYCFGGMAVLELARSGDRIAGVASFHGILRTARRARPGDILCRVMACTGALDPYVPMADIFAFQQEMADAGADWRMVIFGRALHSFITNIAVGALGDERMAYDPEAEAESWALLQLFLAECFR